MHVIIFKYVQLLCFTVFFTNNVNCDQLLMQNQLGDPHLHKIGSCTAACLVKNETLETLESCYKQCSGDTFSLSLPSQSKDTTSFHIKLVCRDSSNLIIEIHNEKLNDSLHATRSKNRKENGQRRRKLKRSIEKNKKHIAGIEDDLDNIDSIRPSIDDVFINETTQYIYLIKIRETGNMPTERLIYMTNLSVIKIEHLSPNTPYDITATIFSSNNQFSYAKDQKQFKTLHKNYLPGKITDITAGKEYFNGNDIKHLDTVVKWKPALDMTCHYEIVFYSETKPDFSIAPVGIQRPEELYKYKLRSLEFNTNYSLGLRAKNKVVAAKESELSWINFTTPQCLTWHRNLDLCAPEHPSNITVTEALSLDNFYKLNISWDSPTYKPNYYVIKVYDLNYSEMEPNAMSMNVTGTANEAYIESFEIIGVHYELTLIAFSNGGSSSATLFKSLDKNLHMVKDSWSQTNFILIILTPIVCIGMIKVLILLICRRKAKLKRYEERCEYFKELEQKAPIDPNSNFDIKSKNIDILQIAALPEDVVMPMTDIMEINRDDVKILEVLGEGAFGLVKKGLLRKDNVIYMDVAVKMLKDCPRIEDIKEFRREIEVMKSVGAHPNIVSIIGHYTKNISEMMLLTEYCSEGNLLDYLRNEWQKLLRHKSSIQPEEDHYLKECLTPALASQKLPENVFNFDTSFVNDKKSVTYKNIAESVKNGEVTTSGGTNFIVNKLYVQMNPLKRNHLSIDKNSCTNSCKSKVEILNSRGSNNNVNMRQCNIKISGCDCGTSEVDVLNNFVENRGYDRQMLDDSTNNVEDDAASNSEQLCDKNEVLCSTDLLKFAKQIALGMEFLAHNKVIHRDLAARNVLVCADKVVKIADFGLSRDVYQENMYRKTGNGKLPIKWLALESMTHQVYTSQSDVWSFGVLLYEIATLGGSPYPSIPTNRLLKLLNTGYRMEKPVNCNDELYDMMYSCWYVHPNDRPSFANICYKLDELLAKNIEDNMIDLNMIVDIVSTKSATIADRSYLKPVEY